ncbi:metallophosphoesterase family protein [Sediminibacillus massiliensis]|uniref:metallophosphoesterase family protein n=1 Tax=Sediminibacillus massiliensis TaxID=1926277 RepID=UPI0009889041|nr:YfcE family phosphodiesterase [Sediminibacillus massiliensis]
MRIAFLSDIHGNADALEAVLEDINKKQADKIYVLGDIAYRGPEPKRSIAQIQSLNTTVIKGNADEWVVRGVQRGEVPDQALALMQKEQAWTVSQLEEKDIDYLSGLPDQATFTESGVTFHLFHATPDSLFDVVLPDADEEKIATTFMQKETADVYLYGHIHKAYIRYLNGRTVINTGSVGLPFDGTSKASYAMVDVENGSISTSIERVKYDIESPIEKYKERQYPNTEMMENIIRNARV